MQIKAGRLLDYGTAESHSKALKESYIDRNALLVIARELAEKLHAYDVSSIDLQQLLKVKNEDDVVSVELVKEINKLLKEMKQKDDI